MTTTLRERNPAEIGLVKKTEKSPSDKISACFKERSAMGVMIKAMTNGAIGIPTLRSR